MYTPNKRGNVCIVYCRNFSVNQRLGRSILTFLCHVDFSCSLDKYTMHLLRHFIGVLCLNNLCRLFNWLRTEQQLQGRDLNVCQNPDLASEITHSEITQYTPPPSKIKLYPNIWIHVLALFVNSSSEFD